MSKYADSSYTEFSRIHFNRLIELSAELFPGRYADKVVHIQILHWTSFPIQNDRLVYRNIHRPLENLVPIEGPYKGCHLK